MKKKKIFLIIVFVIVLFCIVFGITNQINKQPKSANEIFNENLNSIVEVKAYKESIGESYGTAVCIKNDGTFVTNAHVVTYTQSGETFEFDNFYIRFGFENDYREISLLKYDIEKDIAVLKIDERVPIKAISTNKKKLKFGDKVYAIGNGSNYGLAITQGIISMPEVNIEYDGKVRNVIQCDITISAGNSGGALLDKNGKLVGITTFRTKDNLGNVVYGIAYSISINTILTYI